MEVRLNNRQKIKKLFTKLNLKSDLTFKNLFKPAISKKILLYYLDELENKRPPLLDYRAANDKALLSNLILSNPELSTKKILQMYGLSKAMEIINIRELRGMLSKRNQRDWNRLMTDAQEVKLNGIQSPFEVIRDNLTKFKALK